MSVNPEGRTILVYDQNDILISSCVHITMDFFNKYEINITEYEISDWNVRREREFISKSDRVLFFVSMDTEDLHDCLVKQLKLYKKARVLALITYNLELELGDPFITVKEGHPAVGNNSGDVTDNGTTDFDIEGVIEDIVHKAVESIKHLWTNGGVQGRVVTVREKDAQRSKPDFSKVTNKTKDAQRDRPAFLAIGDWWPYILMFLSDNQQGNTDRNREFGIYFHINVDRQAEYEWFERQRLFFEEELKIKCAINDSDDLDDDDVRSHVANSTCVVMYVSESTVKKRQLQEVQKKLIGHVKMHASRCRFRVFVEKLNPSFITMLDDAYSLVKYGEGAFGHWFGILFDLEIVNLRLKNDLIFYSKNARKINYRGFHGDIQHLSINSQRGRRSSRRDADFTDGRGTRRKTSLSSSVATETGSRRNSNVTDGQGTRRLTSLSNSMTMETGSRRDSDFTDRRGTRRKPILSSSMATETGSRRNSNVTDGQGTRRQTSLSNSMTTETGSRRDSNFTDGRGTRRQTSLSSGTSTETGPSRNSPVFDETDGAGQISVADINLPAGTVLYSGRGSRRDSDFTDGRGTRRKTSLSSNIALETGSMRESDFIDGRGTRRQTSLSSNIAVESGQRAASKGNQSTNIREACFMLKIHYGIHFRR